MRKLDENRIIFAADALSAVSDLFAYSVEKEVAHLNSDHFSSLLRLIVRELRVGLGEEV